MKSIQFYKYQGTGNDFVMIDDRVENFDLEDYGLIKNLCDRKFGVGADGLILMRNHTMADFEMIYYNADGYQTSLCGNGSRCAAHFAGFLGMAKDECSFQTIEGILHAKLENDLIEISMPDVKSVEHVGEDYFLHTGSPHYVRFVDNAAGFDVFTNGRNIRNSEKYKNEGVNVDFVESIGNGNIFVRTYERGVENETLSCGTGVTAAAIAYGSLNGLNKINVKTPGGNLSVSFQPIENNGYCKVYLKGPVKRVFKGEIELDV